MLKLAQTLEAWNTSAFEKKFKTDILALGTNQLPLQQGLTHSSYALSDNLKVILLNSEESDNSLIITAGIFYTGMIAGCNCSDDPTPDELYPEYCEVLCEISKEDAQTSISLIAS